MNDVERSMQERVVAGLDPLTGRPSRIIGAVKRTAGGFRDEAGTLVTLENGQWIPESEASDP